MTPPDAESMIGRAVIALSAQESWDSKASQRILLNICNSKEQADNLAKQLKLFGYIERRVVVTDRARKRAAL